MFHDSGYSTVAIPAMHPSGRTGQVFEIPDEVEENQGCAVQIFADGKVSLNLRGILVFDDEFAYLSVDDFTLEDAIGSEPIPPPTNGPSNNEPFTIIQWVYDTYEFDLSTHDGCGHFTEMCCQELHGRNSAQWGHIRKTGAQNQYNGHAVDALYLMAGEGYGVYDIIHDSVSPNAKPACNWKDAGDPSLWYYPA
jgi:hypothetical protein